MTDDLSTAALQELADVTAYPLTAPEEVAARIGDAELLLCNKTPITAAVLDACPNLEYIGVMATGYNNIDFVKLLLSMELPSAMLAAIPQWQLHSIHSP